MLTQAEEVKQQQPALRRVSSLPNRHRSASAATMPSDASDSEAGGYADSEHGRPVKAPRAPRSPRRSPISELRKHLSRPSLKREATSPVYLDPQSISVPSIPSTARRVAQCVSSRLRPSDSDVASVSSREESPRHSLDGPSRDDKKRRGTVQRNKWTKDETDALVRGCNNYGIGQWKAIRDADPVLAKRSPGDLKDRFRTYFPDAYRKHYPNAKTHMSDRQRSKDPKTGRDLFTESANRKERKQFSAAEDEALKRGYAKHGTAWSSIARDPILASRKSTDLRDRFRNAFPDLYLSAAAGYKSRPRKVQPDLYSLTTDQLGLSSGTGMFDPSGVPSYPAYSSRHLEHVVRGNLPSLDFLKTHGASAFSNYRGAFQISDSSDMSSAEDQVPELRELTHTVTPRPNLTTPRPNLTTPRPNDTTPRPPMGSLSAIPQHVMDSNSIPAAQLMDGPYRSGGTMLHKTQSSMDLSQFSHLNLGHQVGPGSDGSFSHESSMSPPSHYADLANSSHLVGGPYVRGQHNYSSPELSMSHSGDYYHGNLPVGQGLGGPGQTHVFTNGNQVASPSDWPDVDLDAASRTFPTAFNYEFTFGNGIMNMTEAQSSTSSLQSSASGHSFSSSSSQSDDRVLYTGMDQPKAFGVAGMRSNSSLSSGAQETLYPGPTVHSEGIFAGAPFEESE